MTPLTPSVCRLVYGEEGADAVEYSLLASLIALAILIGAGALGTKINDILASISGCELPGDGGGKKWGLWNGSNNPNVKCGPLAKF